MLALELEEQGLPQSLSQLEMIAEPIKKRNYSAPWGAQEALQVDLYPASWTVRALLPAEKSRFRFVIATSTPYLILEFEEGKTRHTLLEWDNGDSKMIDEIKPLFWIRSKILNTDPIIWQATYWKNLDRVKNPTGIYGIFKEDF